jgi:hypothetical protein
MSAAWNVHSQLMNSRKQSSGDRRMESRSRISTALGVDGIASLSGESIAEH